MNIPPFSMDQEVRGIDISECATSSHDDYNLNSFTRNVQDLAGSGLV